MIPGAAHIDLGRARRGLLIFFFFAFFVNGALMAPFIGPGREIRISCILIAAGIWILSLYDAMTLAGRQVAARKAADRAAAMAGDDESKKTRRIVKT